MEPQSYDFLVDGHLFPSIVDPSSLIIGNGAIATDDLLAEYPSWGQQSFASTSYTQSSLPSPAVTPIAQDATKRMKSCAACRLRRVKCERRPGETNCIKCQEKKLQCTALPATKRKTPVRTGKRLEQAKELFGTGENHDELEPAKKRPRPSYEERESLVSGVELSETSVVGKLITTELEGVLSSSLLELFSMLPQSRIPLLEASNLHINFEESRRRVANMDSDSQVLFSVILAVSARVSDHPLLVGGAAPCLLTLARANAEGQDLSEWGRKRESACDALAMKAIALADEKGVWRTTSATNLATLLLIEGLLEHKEVGYDPRSEPYAQAYASMLRAIAEDESKPEVRKRVMESGIGWTCYSRNCLMSAGLGRPAAFSPDDIPLLKEYEGTAEPLAVALRSPDTMPPGTPDPHRLPFWRVFHSFMIHLTGQIAMNFAHNLTGRVAKAKPRLDEDYIGKTFDQLDLAKQGAVEVVRRALLTMGEPQNATNEDKGHWTFVRALQQSRCSLVFIFYGSILDRFEPGRMPGVGARIQEMREYSSNASSSEGSPESDEGAYWRRMRGYKDRATTMAFEAARELLDIFAGSGTPMGLMIGTQQLFKRMTWWLPFVTSMPTCEEGGPPEFTFDAKIADLHSALRALHTVGWAFENLARPASWVQSELDKVQAQKARFWQHTIETGGLFGASPVGVDLAFDNSFGSTADGMLSTDQLNQMLEEMTSSINAAEDVPVATPLSGLSSRHASQSRSQDTKDEEMNVVVQMLSSLLG